jgi:hypothetical protein
MNEEGVVVRVVLAAGPAPPPGALVFLLRKVSDRYPVALVELGAALEPVSTISGFDATSAGSCSFGICGPIALA